MLTEDEFTGFLLILGGRIKAIRKEKKLTMRDIMTSARYYDAQWRKYEGGGSINVRALLQIALALDVSLSELLGPLGQWPHKSVAEIAALNEAPQVPAAIRDVL